jgi:hypothetical protein
MSAATILLLANGEAMSNRPDRQPIDPTSVADAEQVIVNLQSKRDALVERGRQLDQVRASNAYAALAKDDAKARQRLDVLNRETAEFSSELASLDSALATARSRLEAAQRAEAKQAGREQAKVLRGALQQFVQHAAGVDSALEVLISSCNGLQESLTAMHRCGSTFPSDAQLLSLGGRVLLGALSKTPFRRNFETLPPLERDLSMARIVTGWSDTVERGIKQRLGDQTNEAA